MGRNRVVLASDELSADLISLPEGRGAAAGDERQVGRVDRAAS